MTTATKEPVRYGISQVICPRCEMPVRAENLLFGLCPACAPRHGSELAAEKGAERRALTRKDRRNMFREITVSLRQSRDLREEHTAAKILKRLAKKAGGTDGIADMMWEDFQAARGEGLTPEEQKRRRSSPTVMGYHKMLQAYVRDSDDVNRGNSPSLSDLDQEDLKATLFSLALELLVKEEQLQDALIPVFLEDHPEVLHRLGYVRLVEEGAA